MKKRILSILLVSAMAFSLLAGCASEKAEMDEKITITSEANELVEVVLNEVAHSIFYAPMYVAIEEGYFAKEGIDLTLVTGFGERFLDTNIYICKEFAPNPLGKWGFLLLTGYYFPSKCVND